MKMRPIAAIDIGSTKVACAVGLAHEKTCGFELLGISLVQYPVRFDSWLSDLTIVSRTIEEALEEIKVQPDLNGAIVALSHPSLSSEQVRTIVDIGDEPIAIKAKDMDRLRRAALNQVLGLDRDPLLVEDLGYSGNGFEKVHDPRGLSVTRLAGNFNVVTIPSSARRSVIQAVESAGIGVNKLVYALSAIFAGIEDEATRRKMVLLIDIGGVSTDIGIFSGGVLEAAKALPYGGQALSASIAREFSVTMEQAMSFSLEGFVCRKHDVRDFIERYWQGLSGAAREILNGKSRPDIILLGGRGALIDGLAEFLEKTIEVPTQLCRSSRAHMCKDLSKQVGLCAAIGLLEDATRQSNGIATAQSPLLFHRLIDRTKSILAEYF